METKKDWLYHFGFGLALYTWKAADWLDKHLPGFEDGTQAAYAASVSKYDGDDIPPTP